MVERKSSLGRQKIKLQKITKKNHLQVTFSKRRSGLFKKASELCTLCGVDVAIVVFSPADKAFTFGNPDVDSILDKFLANSQIPSTTSTLHHLIEAHRKANVHDLNVQLSHVVFQLELEKKRGEVLTQTRKDSQSRCWWECQVEELRLDQLEHLKCALEELKKNVAKQASGQVPLELMGTLPLFSANNKGFGYVGSFQGIPEEAYVPAIVDPHVDNFNFDFRHRNF